MEKRIKNKGKLQQFYENLSDELSENENIDKILEQEGINPAQLVKNGLDKIKLFQDQLSSTTLIHKIKTKISNIENKFSNVSFDSLEKILFDLNTTQLNAVYRSISNEFNDLDKGDSDLIKMRAEIKLNDLMKDINKI